MTINAALIGAFCGFLTLGSLSPLPLALLWCCGMAFAIGLMVQWLLYNRWTRLTHRFIYRGWLVSQCILSFLLTASYANSVLHRQLAQRNFQPRIVTTQVKVVGISQSVGERVRQIVQPITHMDGLPEKWLVSPDYKTRHHVAKQLNHVKAGDICQITAEIRPPHGVASRGVFSEQRWLLGLKVAGRAAVQAAECVEPSAQLTLKDRLANYRLGLRKRITGLSSDTTDGQDKAVLLALLTGDRALINRATKDTYQHMGISHLLAISGPHVLFAASMFAFVLIKLLNLRPRSYQWLPRRTWVLPSSLIVAIGYALLAGWDLPAQRTVLMFATTVFLLLLGKRLSFWWVMLLSATIILMIDPLAVLSAGFWLSFVAVGLLVLLSQPALLAALQADDIQQLAAVQQAPLSNGHQLSDVQTYVQRFKAFVSLQLVFFMAILPITLLFFGKASWLTPFVNLIAIPLLGLVVVPLNIVAFVVDMISPTLATLIWHGLLWVLHVFHASMVWLQDAFPEALMGMHLDKTALWAFALLLFLWLLPTDKRLRLVSIPLVALILMPRQLPAPAVVRVFDGTTFTATVVQVQKQGVWRTQQTMLYLSDIKADANYQYELQHHVLPSLTAYDVGKIDTLVVSVSGNALPTGMLATLIERFDVQKILTNADISESETVQYDSKMSRCDSEVSWQWGQVRFDGLSPWKDVPVSGDDAACTLKLSIHRGQQTLPDDGLYSMLLMGNASAFTEKMQLALCDNLQADILLLPRQGQQSKTQTVFLNSVKPKRAVSGVKRGDYRELPHLQTRAQLLSAGVVLDTTATGGTTTYYLGTAGTDVSAIHHERTRWPWLAID